MPAISYQLYNSRKWPLDEVMTMLVEVGFTEVEGYGALFQNPSSLITALDATNLRMTTGHFGLEPLESDPSAAIKLAKRLGIEAIFVPHLDVHNRPLDVAGWEAFATRLVEAGKPIQDAGLAYGWHNHAFELAELSVGLTPLDVIANSSPDMKLELDLGWVIRAGTDPAEAIQKYSGQIISAHIKDLAPAGENLDEDGWADVGHGIVNWAPLHSALQNAGVDRYIIEHDNPNDHRRFATQSFKFVSKF